MSQLASLKSATSLQAVANLLGFKPKALAFILYKKPAASKYYHFEIPKRSGGKRSISAPYPDLMKLQRRLSELLQSCISEIDEKNQIRSNLSHGFRRKHSIITNAAVHRHKRYVFNLDLEDFFGTINFGRVRGFFITNKNFELNPTVATILAQIACYNNVLPQGSPCSPVISNLIGHILDIRLVQLAYRAGCDYSRYADDLTFSTNKPLFSHKIAKLVNGESFQWQPSKELKRIIEKEGFTINPEKTRMQLRTSRQDVTGLVVNKKVNIRSEYGRTARAMVHRLLKTGKFYRSDASHDDQGNLIVKEVDGTLEQLNGILSFIDTVSVYNFKKSSRGKKKQAQKADLYDAKEKVYQRFLFYRNFYAAPLPVIVCEGKTDNIYIRSAIRRLSDEYPELANRDAAGNIRLMVRIYRYTNTSARLLDLSGGATDLGKFVRTYKSNCDAISTAGCQKPIILLIDNDDGANGKGGIYNAVKEVTGTKPDGSLPIYHVCHNLYVVPTPLLGGAKSSKIEDFFDSSVTTRTLGGKKFNPVDNGFDNKTEYGKYLFAEHVVKKGEATIDFAGFRPLLDNFRTILKSHKS